MTEPAYTWTGWHDGESDCEPPEPGKEWIEIRDPDGEEMAIIVHRRTDHPDSEKWRAQRERDAQIIVDALNAQKA